MLSYISLKVYTNFGTLPGEQANLSIFAIMICLVVITGMFGPIIVLSLFADAHRLQEKPDQQQRIFLA